MERRSYKVVLEGTIISGFDRGMVLRNLSKLFNRSPELIEKLLSGESRVIKKGLDFATAGRYHETLKHAGAMSHIEPEYESATEMPEPEISQSPSHGPSDDHVLVCPRCGYKPSSADDVLAIRGDCPRCGLIVRKDTQISALLSDEEESVLSGGALNPYGDRTPASWKRRILASIHTFTIFLAAYFFLFLIFILFVLPVDRIFQTMIKDFLPTVLAAFPVSIMSLTVFLVCFVLPLVTGGRSWGQQLTDIEVFYAGETRGGDLYLSLAFRAAAVLIVSFAPGMAAVRIGQWLGLPSNHLATQTMMIAMGALGWMLSWIFAFSRLDARGVLDLAGSTIQVESEPLPADAVRKALIPFLAIVALWVVFGLVIPYLLKG